VLCVCVCVYFICFVYFICLFCFSYTSIILASPELAVYKIFFPFFCLFVDFVYCVCLLDLFICLFSLFSYTSVILASPAFAVYKIFFPSFVKIKALAEVQPIVLTDVSLICVCVCVFVYFVKIKALRYNS
jgi:hypothetical protein